MIGNRARLASLVRRGGKSGLEALVAPFHGDGHLGVAEYEGLFRYFVEGWATRVTASGALAVYPGWGSRNGTVADRMEGFSRVVPLLGAWVHGGRSPHLDLSSGQTIDLVSAFRRGLLAGTEPGSTGYWGALPDRDQRIVEAADVALALWLLREPVWDRMEESERRQVVRWLSQVNEREGHDNNWHLFAILVQAVLRSLDPTVSVRRARERYKRVVSFYRGDGWFSDGEHGSFDYYNAWGFHYSLFWLNQIDPDWDPGFIRDALAAFLSSYRYLIGPEGFPMVGRSACYRMAAPAPLVFGQSLCPEQVAPGEARRALDATWRYFVRRGALRGGNVTQGYFGDDPRLLENYSGPASCLWSLRSLVSAFYLPDTSAFWRSPSQPLPVEIGDYRIHVPTTGWTIVGRKSDRSITVEMPNPWQADTRLVPHGLRCRLLALAVGRPQRPENYEAKYGRPTYSSAQPLAGAESGEWWRW